MNRFLETLGVLGIAILFWGSLLIAAWPYIQKPESKEESPVESHRNFVVKKQEEQETETVPELVCLGEFKLTAYCGEYYPHICNDGNANQTSTGVAPKAGRTIAVDPKVIPYGTRVYIDGKEYIAEDCGGAIKEKRIDLFFDTHDEALDFGVQKKMIYVEAK